MKVQISYTRAKLNTEGLSSTQNWVTDRHTRCFFVNLDRCLVRIDPDNLCYRRVRLKVMTESELNTSDQFVVTDANKFVHSRTRHVLCDDDRARDPINLTEARFAVLVTDLWEIFLCIR